MSLAQHSNVVQQEAFGVDKSGRKADWGNGSATFPAFQWLRLWLTLEAGAATNDIFKDGREPKPGGSCYLLGLSGAVVLHQYFWFIEGIACGGTKYVTQWHLVSMSSRTYTKFSDQLYCLLVNFRNNWSFYSTKERFPGQKFRHWHCFTSSSTYKGRVWL